jgi:hypothetical protein
MASGSGGAPAGDGTSLPSPLSVIHALHLRTHTITIYTRLDPHLVDPKIHQYEPNQFYIRN